MGTFSRTFTITPLTEEIAVSGDSDIIVYPDFDLTGYNWKDYGNKLGNYKSKSTSTPVKYASLCWFNEAYLPLFNNDRIKIKSITLQMKINLPAGDDRSKYLHLAFGSTQDATISIGNLISGSTVRRTITADTDAETFAALEEWMYGAKSGCLTFIMYDANTTYKQMDNGHYYSRNYIVSWSNFTITVEYEYLHSITYKVSGNQIEVEMFVYDGGKWQAVAPLTHNDVLEWEEIEVEP
jgi:hypothetical protein